MLGRAVPHYMVIGMLASIFTWFLTYAEVKAPAFWGQFAVGGGLPPRVEVCFQSLSGMASAGALLGSSELDGEEPEGRF